MRTLIDITSIHRIGEVINTCSGDTIRSIDAVALLHFAEVILFSDSSFFFDFDGKKITEQTERIMKILEDNDCLPLIQSGNLEKESGGTTRILEGVEANVEKYADACRIAGLSIASMLSGWLTRENLANLATTVDDAAQPKYSNVDHVSKIVTKNSSEFKRKNEGIENLRKRGGDGAINYMLNTVEPLRDSLLRSIRDCGPFSDIENLAFRCICRIILNRTLARKRENSIYCPAPQRARMDELVERSFRHKVNAMLMKLASKSSHIHSYTGLMDTIYKREILPLPALAIGVLSDAVNSGPLGLLRLAAIRRYDSKIKEVRQWIRRWEEAEAKRSIEKMAIASDELRRREKDLKIDLKLEKPKSIFRVGLRTIASWIKGEIPEVEGVENVLSLISERVRRGSTTRSFLSLISDRLASENDLGRWLLEALDRTVVLD